MRSVLIGAVGSTKKTLETMIGFGTPPVSVFTVTKNISHRNSDYVDLEPSCKAAGIPLRHFQRVNDAETIKEIRAFQPDIIWVIGLSQLVKQPLLDIPRIGTIGFHPSKLPKNRGRGVIAWTIIQDLQETGSTLFWLDNGVDSGPILKQEIFTVAKDETITTLMIKHGNALGKMIVDVLPELRSAKEPRSLMENQDHNQATWCARRTPEDALIDWIKPAREIWTLVRASGRPYPGAYTTFRSQQVTIWEADLEDKLKGKYWGFPGQVQDFKKGFPLVQCGDGNHIIVKEMTFRSEEALIEINNIRLHERFGGKRNV
jgi:methionyl-tRNA formyltransferase